MKACMECYLQIPFLKDNATVHRLLAILFPLVDIRMSYMVPITNLMWLTHVCFAWGCCQMPYLIGNGSHEDCWKKGFIACVCIINVDTCPLS